MKVIVGWLGGAWGNSYNSCSQAVNHLTIKPYIPPSATLETLPAAAASSSPLPHSSSSCTSASASECGAGPLLTSNSSLSSSSRVKGGGGPNDSRSGRRRKSLQAPSVSTSPRSKFDFFRHQKIPSLGQFTIVWGRCFTLENLENICHYIT